MWQNLHPTKNILSLRNFEITIHATSFVYIGEFLYKNIFKNLDLKRKKDYVTIKKLEMLAAIFGAVVTGKPLSEAHIFASTNPQYDNRLFNELRVQYTQSLLIRTTA